MVSAPGVGSGLDVNSLVEQLVAAERQPVANRINLAEARVNQELSALGQLKSSIASFQDALDLLSDIDNFQVRTVDLDAEDFISVTASSEAVKGSYDIEVQALANAQKLASQAFVDTVTPIGTGDITISLGGSVMLVSIADGANTLEDIRDAINDSQDNPGVSATIVTADDGARLILNSDKTGVANQIVVATSGGDGGLAVFDYDPLSGTNPMTELQAATDAVAVIDGFTVTNSTNTIDAAVEGLSISLLDAEVGNSTRVTIDFDQSAANAALTSFVDSYNSLASTIDQLTSFDAETGVAGTLLGDSIVRDIESSVRREISSVVDLGFDAPFSLLAEIGITTDLSGKLEIDTTKSADAIAENFDDVGRLFAKEDDGIAVRLDAVLARINDEEGTIDLREDRLNGRLEELKDQRDRLDERMVGVQARLFKQFSALDTLLAQFQSTSSFLTASLANLPTPRPPSNSR